MQSTLTTQHLGHTGIVAAIIKELGIVERIDKRLPVSKEHGSIVTMGQRVAAMILNGLGFFNDRLYMHSDFFDDKPVSRLLGKGIEAKHLNDDALARALDEIYEYGTTKLFSEVAFGIASDHDLLGRTARLDTTSLPCFGEYPEDNAENDNLNITYGYSKNKRFDLKQIVLSMTNTGPAGIPIWLEALDGNSADQTNFHATTAKITAFREQLKNAPSFIFIADSALYTPSKLLASKDLRWVTRVPGKLLASKALLELDDVDFIWQELEDGYKFCESTNNYGDIEQRWQVIFSKQSYAKETKSLESRIIKEKEALEKKIWHLGNKDFSCENDAHKAYKLVIKDGKYHNISYVLESITKHIKKGRPSAGATPVISGYKIVSTIVVAADRVKLARNRAGRFILATNELNHKTLPSNDILIEYKSLSKIEKGFKFIKSTEFLVSSIFLKKQSRIEALTMVMTLCLMVYNFGEYKFRKILEDKNDTIPNQVGKRTATPTLRWLFRILNKISVGFLVVNGLRQEIVANVCMLCQKIIIYFGKDAMDIYGVT